MAIKGEFDGLDSLEFVSFDTISMSFSPSTDEGVGFDEVEEEGKGVDEPTPTLLAVVVEMKEESVERSEETNDGFNDVLMLLVKGVEGK